MSETNETEGKAARGGSKMTLNVRRTVESGHVRQSFSHGRSKSVLVEKKKRRAIGSTPTPQPVEEAEPKPQPQVSPRSPRSPRPRRPLNSAPRVRCCASSPTRRRMRAAKALYDARQRDADERARAVEHAAVEVATRDMRVKEE